MAPSLILIVEDDIAYRRLVARNLEARGYAVLQAGDVPSAIALLEGHLVNLLILDIGLPGVDGLDFLHHIRADQIAIPVIVLSALDQERDKVKALDLGADDYLTKFIGAEELLARVRAALRRGGRTSAARSGPPTYQTDELVIDFQHRQVRRGDMALSLTAKEYDVLAYLAEHAGQVLTHRQILQAVWGTDYGNEPEYLWTFVRRIRQKIEPDPAQPRYVLTETGVGYRMLRSDEPRQ